MRAWWSVSKESLKTLLFLREILDKNKHNFEIIEFKEKETKKISQKGYFTGLAVNA